MSEPGHSELEHTPLRQEEERLPTGTILAIGGGSVLLFIVAVIISTWFMNWTEAREVPHRAEATEVVRTGEAEVGIVDLRLFEVERRATDQRDQQRRHLESYGWVDRQQQVVHIPIERAMDLVVEGRRPRGSTPAAAPVDAPAPTEQGTEGGAQ